MVPVFVGHDPTSAGDAAPAALLHAADMELKGEGIGGTGKMAEGGARLRERGTSSSRNKERNQMRRLL